MKQREWKKIKDFEEILFEEYNGIAKITINRPRYRNAFTPRTTLELSQAFAYCREASRINVVLLTGAGDKAFCSGGDMHVKGRGGYGWHISNRKIYDRPRPLSDFTRLRATKFGYEPVNIERPPQSWFYVEELYT